MIRKRKSLKNVLIGFIVVLLIFTNLSLGLPSYLFAKRELELKGNIVLSNAVEMAIDKIDTMAMNVEKGIISLEDAQEEVKAFLIGPMQADGTRLLNTPIDLGQQGYFLAYNDEGYEVMHPTIEGEYVYDVLTPDKDKLPVVKEQLRVGRDGGYLEYNWYFPGQEKIGRKLSYSKYEPKWGWTVVATAYATDFNAAARRITTFMVSLFVITAVFVFLFTNHQMDKLLKPVSAIIQAMKKNKHNQLNKVAALESHDELSDLVDGYNEMIDALTNNMDKLKRREKQLKKLAYMDELTDLPNMNMMEHYLERQKEKGQLKGFFVLLDIKELKMINSIYGISFGDEMIKIVGSKLQQMKPCKSAFLTRLAGNEFGLYVPETDEGKLKGWFDGVHDYWHQEFYAKHLEVRVALTMSYADLEAEDDFDVILQKVNIAMQFAKASEKDMVKYSRDIYEVIEHESTLKVLAEKGIDKDEFYPVYQEKVSLVSGKVSGVEALARWDSSELGFVSPGEFIPVLNKTKLILDFTEKMIEYIFDDYKHLVDKYDDNVSVSINISPLFFMSDRFVNFILEKAGLYQVPTHAVILEITEDVLMDNTDLVNRKVVALRQAGFKISLDDFGTGYSSLSYLQKIMLDEVKIDKSLIDDIVTSDSARQMLTSIIEVIHNLGYMSVAEGVETKEQLEIIQKASCHMVQGYYYSKPEKLIKV